MIKEQLTEIKNRESIILSIHPHNDRGCGVNRLGLGARQQGIMDQY